MPIPHRFPKRTFQTALLLLLCLHALHAQTTQDAIAARLKGQPLFLRGSWGVNDLKFDTDGQLKKTYDVMPFTECGIDVQSVKLSGKQLTIEGQRMGVWFKDEMPERVAIAGAGYKGTIRIEVDGVDGQDFGKALDAIFAPDLAAMVPTMPTYWQEYARKHFLPPGTLAPEDVTPASSKPLHIGGTVEKPKLIGSADPQLSSVARLLKHPGNVVVYLWVMEDGSPSHLTISKPAGLGLDEQALLAVSKYKFQPATLDGKPVKVDLHVNVNFQIF